MIKKSIELQIKCMLKLGIKQNAIDKICAKYDGDDLLNKLIDYETLHSKQESENDIKMQSFNKCRNKNKMCGYFDKDDLRCVLDLECVDGCKQYSNIWRMLGDLPEPELDMNIEKIALIENCTAYEKSIISKIRMQEIHAEIKVTKIWDILRDKNIRKRLLTYHNILESQYGY